MAAEHEIETVRAFSRLFTQRIGALDEGLNDSPFPLVQARILFELAQAGTKSASALIETLGLDAGYLSRILKGFEARGLIARTPNRTDGRRAEIRLTEAGRAAFAPLEASTRMAIGSLLDSLPGPRRSRLVEALGAAQRAFDPSGAPAIELRPERPGDLGWVVSRHGVLYAREYGWDDRFEALVARVCADYLGAHEAGVERFWIAEQHGERLGSVAMMRGDAATAKLRLLIVEPEARGLGVGSMLVDACIAHAKACGFARLALWTNANLLAARRLYAARGFILEESVPHRSFGHDLVGETWSLGLA